MATDRWQRLQEIFDAALARSGAEREKLLDEACRGDPGLRAEVEALLRSDSRANSGDGRAEPASAAFASGGFGLAGGDAEEPTSTGWQGSGSAPVSGVIRDLEAAFASARRAHAGVMPQSIGPYRIIEALGEGGMGVVYLAEQVEPLRRRVALKLIRAGRATAAAVNRFRAEIETLAQMSHPGIARVYDAGVAPGGNPYFVMEHIEKGVPLDDYADAHRLRVRDRLEIFIQLCEAIQHAHQKGVVHRDIKPSNVLVTEEQGVAHPKVIDFGIAKAVGEAGAEQTLITETGQIIGTPGYMSPEQISGGAVPIDTRTDIYALGAVLYELLTGVLPFHIDLGRSGLLDALLTIREKDPVPPSVRLARLGDSASDVISAARARRAEPVGLRRELRGDLDWIALKALERDPERRYSSVSELATDVRRHLGDRPVLAGPPDTAYLVRKFVRRHRWQVLTAAAALAVLFLFGAGAWMLDLRQGRAQLESGAAARRDFEAQRGEADALERRWKERKAANRTFQPPWEREEELGAWRALGEHRKRLEGRFNDAVASFASAMDVAPVFSGVYPAARTQLCDLYFDRYRESLDRGGIILHPEFFRGLVESLGSGKYRRELTGIEEVTIATDPPGADVYCFRLEESDAHRVPIPFDPRRGRLGETFLRVARTWPGETPFESGDRLIRLVQGEADRPIRTHGELARSLASAGEDEPIAAIVIRKDTETRLPWTPFPKARVTGVLRAGRLLDTAEQLHLTFEGYPIDTTLEARLGSTSDAAPFSTQLEPGTYLFVLRKEGFVDLRLPVSIPGGGGSRRVKLYRPEEIPPDFVLVAAGRFAYGGDPEAYESLDAGTEDVADFFIRRNEVTLREYLEFLNAPETLERLARADEEGRIPPAVDWNEGALRVLRPQDERGVAAASVDLIPRIGRQALYRRREEAYELTDRNTGGWPVLGLSLFAALEYTRWLTASSGGRWTFRLPTDFEWEKSARGADRRLFVWGDYPMHSFAKSRLGAHPRSRADESDVSEVGLRPMDESVYGVLDLCGSVAELVVTDPSRLPYALRFATVRGASFDATDARDYHIASRNRVLPEKGERSIGLRIVATPAHP